MHIGMRTIKTAVGTAAAMLIAYSLHLEYWAAAGIITILSVQNTTKASFRLVAYRLLATLLGFVIAIGAFLVLGYNAFAFGVFLVIFIPITNVFAVQSGIVMTAVLVTHFMMARSCSWFWIKTNCCCWQSEPGWRSLPICLCQVLKLRSWAFKNKSKPRCVKLLIT